jgi:hypothetical protein
VKVGVDQTGEEREALRIDHFRAGGNLYCASVADCDNLFSANDNDCIEQWRTATAVNQRRSDDGNGVVCIGLRDWVHFMKRSKESSGPAASRLRKRVAIKKECDEYGSD